MKKILAIAALFCLGLTVNAQTDNVGRHGTPTVQNNNNSGGKKKDKKKKEEKKEEKKEDRRDIRIQDNTPAATVTAPTTTTTTTTTPSTTTTTSTTHSYAPSAVSYRSTGNSISDDWSKMAVGANLNVGFDDVLTNFGIGAKFQYRFIKQLRGEASVNIYLPKYATLFWDANINVHYLFPIGSTGLTAYPLAGFNVMGASDTDGIYSAISSFGVNYGGGIEYQLTDGIKVNAEIKGQTGFSSDWWGTRGIFSLGASYCF